MYESEAMQAIEAAAAAGFSMGFAAGGAVVLLAVVIYRVWRDR